MLVCKSIRRPSGLDLALFGVQAGACFHCGGAMSRDDDADGWSREHVVPRAAGGFGLLHNIVLAHWRCNNARGDADPSEDMLTRSAAIYEVIRVSHPQFFAIIPAPPHGHPRTMRRRERRIAAQVRMVGHDHRPMTFRLGDAFP